METGSFESTTSESASSEEEEEEDDDEGFEERKKNINETKTKLPVISMNEVAEHADPSDAWMVIYDKVFDVTSFLNEVFE